MKKGKLVHNNIIVLMSQTYYYFGILSSVTTFNSRDLNLVFTIVIV